MKSKHVYLGLMVCVLQLIGCSGSDDPVVEPVAQTVKTQAIDARDYSKWVYFSFEKGAVVSIGDGQFQQSIDWDIAFHRNDVRINSGLSGPGNGGAQTAAVHELAQVTEAPQGGYVEDALKSIMVKFQLPVPLFEDQPASAEIDWLSVDTSNPPPKYTLHDKVFLVKTAQGKYAKLKFKSYLSDLNETMVIKFDYVYQADGSRNLK